MTRRQLLAWVALAVFVGALGVLWMARQAGEKNSPAMERILSGGGAVRPPQFQFSFGQAPGEESLGNPLAVYATATEIYVSDGTRGCVEVFGQDGVLLRTIGGPGAQPGQFRYPYGIAVADGKLYVADMGAAAILTFDSAGAYLGNLTVPGLLSKPTNLKLHGTELYVADAGLHQVVVLDGEGRLVRRIGTPGEGNGELRFPNGVAVAADGTTYVSDSGNNRVQVFDAKGAFRMVITGGGESGPLTAPRGIDLDAGGRLYVAAGLSNAVAAFDATGVELFRLSAAAGTAGALSMPTGIAIDPDGRIYVAESGNRRVSLFR